MFKSKQNDIFADIASMKVDLSKRNLIAIEPISHEKKQLKLSGDGIFNSQKKISTKEELNHILKEYREKYLSYMKDKAPKQENLRSVLELKEFSYRQETKEDLLDFRGVQDGEGDFEDITIPHFGGPLGKKSVYYRKVINLEEIDKADSCMVLRFEGVDYKAEVFFNNAYVGSHEGFFAPFEFDVTPYIKEGENVLLIKVLNDYIFGRSISEDSSGERYGGDKLYAATNLGYDDWKFGWHHCPPGMGIYQRVFLEKRARVYIEDLAIIPNLEEKKATMYAHIYSCDVGMKKCTFELSLYGQNFDETIFENVKYELFSQREIGIGDSFNETRLKASGMIDKPVILYMEKGINYVKITFDIKNPKVWTLDSPWLYQLQLKVKDANEKVIDVSKQSFGMRSFKLDTDCEPKGMFYLNGEKIRLRGANTMGHMQQCVYKDDLDQLIDDILLAKICNMNFLRLTQRPVQDVIYDYCDKLGLMTQTDLPLFGVLRKNKYTEALKQVEEMILITRKYVCNTVISYINEPFPNADNAPHRHLQRKELEGFFDSADMIVKLYHENQVIKHVDGDYDPPSKTLPDNHCYNGWYNGNGVDIGKLNKGYWLNVKPGWNYGCGEFGVEGLDPLDVMLEMYPKHWLPTEVESEEWSPYKIIGAQTGNFHYCYYETPKTIKGWIEASREYQAFAVKLITEAYRRDRRMVTMAIHLFIDAFPSGWMKTIMDCKRQPKPAYFAYRDALSPIMLSIRTDNFKYIEDKNAIFEMHVCNDTNIEKDAELYYYIESDNEILASGREKILIEAQTSNYHGEVVFKLPIKERRKKYTIHAALFNKAGELIHENEMNFEGVPDVVRDSKVLAYSSSDRMKAFIDEIELTNTDDISNAKVIFVDEISDYENQKAKIESVVEKGAKLIFMDLNPGEYEIFDEKVEVKSSALLPMHFVSRDTGHEYVEGFLKNDFKYWYHRQYDVIIPIIKATINHPSYTSVLLSGNTNSKGEWETVTACGQRKYGKGEIILCQVDFVNRTMDNPIAKAFAYKVFA